MTFWIYRDIVAHECKSFNRLRSVYRKGSFTCITCNIEVPWILTVAVPQIDINGYDNYCFLGGNAFPIDDFRKNAIEYEILDK